MTVTVLQGDCRDILKTLDADSVDCVVTSPPYWGLRDYGVEGQMGLEGSLGEHLDGMVDVFREVRRVLKPTGTLWLNYGDAYASAPNGRSAADTKAAGNDDRTFRDKPISTVGAIYQEDHRPNGTNRSRGLNARSKQTPGSEANVPLGRVVAGGFLKPKDRMLLPARLAIALQEDGWWVRDEIIWHKPNPMPSSVKDRTTPAHEMIYMLSKSARYYFDQEAILEPVSANTHARLAQHVIAQIGSARANGGVRADRPMKAVSRKSDKQQDMADHSNPNTARTMGGFNDRYFNSPKTVEAGLGIKNNQSFASAVALPVLMRNKRSVWTVPPKGFKEAHFATFPPDLIRPCILAGCPVGGVVLDPFYGAGTVGLVADETGRDCIGIELNPAYIEIAVRRVNTPVGMFA